ncbi:hypothetical protein ENC_41000 [Enterobacter hormaechei]|nr:hypothetical protein ENC_41000 [Enterobacter hormaechei]
MKWRKTARKNFAKGVKQRFSARLA